MITLNVIFTPRTPARLIPFATSLLKGSGVTIRLVDNGCGADESPLLREAAERSDRISYYSLAAESPVEHGLALNHLFERFREEHFAMADSDVIASGDFMADLHPLLRAGTSVFSGSPVWATENDVVISKESTWIGARHREFEDGTSAGNSYFAIYPRAALESVWDAAPRGFGVVDSYELPRERRDAFAGRGWRFVLFDTTRVLNLLLLLAGHDLAHRVLPDLHHVGGFSAQHFARKRHRAAALAGGALAIMRSNEGSRVQRLIDASRHHLFIARSRRDPAHRQMNVRRARVIEHVRDAADAIRSNRDIPPVPDFASRAVDEQVAALTAALAVHCRPDRSRSPVTAGEAGSAPGDQQTQ
ncbi:MAG: hypothetical protein HKN20_06130 [Gemmatimonadetes bacterium]|nr:hypothetical protein [Gemmatimonadota bacterium]